MRGKITRTDSGWRIEPGVWPEPKAPARSDGELAPGRLVQVTFMFVVDEATTRAALDEDVEGRLNVEFEVFGPVVLEDLGLRTDVRELTEEALRA